MRRKCPPPSSTQHLLTQHTTHNTSTLTRAGNATSETRLLTRYSPSPPLPPLSTFTSRAVVETLKENEPIVRQLESVVAKLKGRTSGVDQYRYNGYVKACDTVRRLPWKITSQTVGRLVTIKGLGGSLLRTITHIVDNNGALPEDKARLVAAPVCPNEAAMAELQGIWGVGPGYAKRLLKWGVRGVGALRRDEAVLRCLNDAQQIGLKRYEDLQVRNG